MKLPVKPKAAALKALAQKGKAKVKVLITYVRRDGGSEVESKTLVLRKKRG